MNGDAPEENRGEKRKEPESEEDKPDTEKGKEKESPKKKQVRFRWFWPSSCSATQFDHWSDRGHMTTQISCTSLSMGSFTEYNPNWF